MNIVEITPDKQVAPFLRWAGSKRQLIPHLYPYWAKKRYDKYIEPFLGAGHLYFSINNDESILSDINQELINAYNIIKYKPVELYENIVIMPIEKEFYYKLRSVNPLTLSPVDRAARFIYLNRFCFNGLYRTNLQGQFNVPFSPVKSGGIPSLNNLLSISRKLQSTQIICSDFESTINNYVKKNDFVYLDPPYFTQGKSFTEYSSSGFKKDDLIRIIKSLEYIDSVGATFLLSYTYDEEIIKMFDNWNIEIVETNRKISSSLITRVAVNEIIVSNINIDKYLY